MLAPAVVFSQVVLAIHVVFVVAAFGIVVIWPLLVITAERIDPRLMPLMFRLRQLIGRTIINPGLLILVIAGVYLAADLHQWGQFYVQWGIGAVIVLGALEGSFAIRQSGALSKLAERDVAVTIPGEPVWSAEYLAVRQRADQVNALMAVIVIVTVFVMVVQ